MSSIELWLRSVETDLPFSHCLHCRLPLLETNTEWLVNKDYHRGECVIEYAICKTCRDQVTDQLSEKSKLAVRRFLEERIEWDKRIAEYVCMANPVERFTKCIACRHPRESLDAYAVTALFDSGGELVTGPLPLMICGACTEAMGAVLSGTSRKVWRDFLEPHFTGPPGATAFPGLL